MGMKWLNIGELIIQVEVEEQPQEQVVVEVVEDLRYQKAHQQEAEGEVEEGEDRKVKKL